MNTALRDFWRRLGGVGLFLWTAPLVLAACVLGGIIPQQEEAAPLVRWLGLNALFSRWWFSALLVLLGINLAVCSLSRLRTLRWAVWLTHAGMLVILAGGLVTGLAGRHGSLRLETGRDAAEAPARGGGTLALPFGVRLVSFTIERHGADRHVLLPANAAPGGAIALEPGKDVAIAPGTTVRLLTSYPDFVMGDHGPESRSTDPRNPAAQVEVRRGGKRTTVWLFERFPEYGHAHGASFGLPDLRYRFEPARIKQFASEVEVLEEGRVVASRRIAVNTPLRWKGWTLYQSGYDRERDGVSVLQVSHDPGTPVVYAGFILMPLGLLLTALDRRSK